MAEPSPSDRYLEYAGYVASFMAGIVGNLIASLRLRRTIAILVGLGVLVLVLVGLGISMRLGFEGPALIAVVTLLALGLVFVAGVRFATQDRAIEPAQVVPSAQPSESEGEESLNPYLVEQERKHLESTVANLGSELRAAETTIREVRERSLRVECDGYLVPTGKYVDSDWRLHLWFDFSCALPPTSVPLKWERIKYSVNIMGADVASKRQEDDFDVGLNGPAYRYTTVVDVPATVGARAASYAAHLQNPSVLITIHVARTPLGVQVSDRASTFFVRIMGAPTEVIAWASKNDLIR